MPEDSNGEVKTKTSRVETKLAVGQIQRSEDSRSIKIKRKFMCLQDDLWPLLAGKGNKGEEPHNHFRKLSDLICPCAVVQISSVLFTKILVRSRIVEMPFLAHCIILVNEETLLKHRDMNRGIYLGSQNLHKSFRLYQDRVAVLRKRVLLPWKGAYGTSCKERALLPWCSRIMCRWCDLVTQYGRNTLGLLEQVEEILPWVEVDADRRAL